jgi:hypothetical protein
LTKHSSQFEPQETARSAIRGCGEVLLSIGVSRGVCSMACHGVRQHRRADDKNCDSNSRCSHTAVSCKKDSRCPFRQRCGFTSGCESKGKCIVPSGNTSCIDPGGRCGCDGRPVDIFCRVGSRIEFTSAPVNAVGPCPRPCTKELGCGSRLVCEKGFCIEP